MYLHLYKDGALLYFYLLGLNDNQIKTYLDSLPFFADSYDIRSPFLSYDGLSYYHDKIKERLDSMQASIDSLTQQLSTLS